MRYIQIVGEMFPSADRDHFKIHIPKKIALFLSQQHSALHSLVFPLCLHFNMWTPARYRGPDATRQLTLEPRGGRVDKECHHSPQGDGGGAFFLSLARCICFLSEQQDSEGERAALRCGVLILETKSLSDSHCFITHQSDGGSWQRENTQIGPA